MSYVNPQDTLYKIVSDYPETIDVFKSNGFPQMGDPAKRESFGKSINLSTALMLKRVDAESYIRLLNDTIDGKRNSVDATLAEKQESSADAEPEDTLEVAGLLPCPVRAAPSGEL